CRPRPLPQARRPRPPARSGSIHAPARWRADAAGSPVGLQLSRRVTRGTVPTSACSSLKPRQEHAMPHPVRDILAASAALVVAFIAIPLFAQSGAGLLEGTAAFGDWHGDHPGVRRIIRPQDLPAPNTAAWARNFVREVRRTDQKPIVPNGFEVNLFASALTEPRIIRVAPNGDVFVAESGAGRIRVLRPSGNGAAPPSLFASGLRYPFGIAFY